MILLVIYCVTIFDIFGLDCVNPSGSEHLITDSANFTTQKIDDTYVKPLYLD